jgi:hypothetical protein
MLGRRAAGIGSPIREPADGPPTPLGLWAVLYLARMAHCWHVSIPRWRGSPPWNRWGSTALKGDREVAQARD